MFNSFLTSAFNAVGNAVSNHLWWSPIHTACNDGNVAEVRRLLEEKQTEVNRVSRGQLPSHRAAKIGHNELILLLLEHNAPFDTPDREGRLPLHRVCEQLHEQCLVTLLRAAKTTTYSASFKTRDKGIEAHSCGLTPFQALFKYGIAQCHSQEALERLKRMARALVKAGANARARDKSGRTALHMLASVKEVGNAAAEACLLLINEYNLSTVEKDSTGFIPLHCAAAAGHVAAIDVLSRDIARTSASSDTAVIEWKTNDGKTALHLAAANGKLTALQKLVSLGAHIHSLDSRGRPPLVDAVCSGSTACIAALRHAGAPILVEDFAGPDGLMGLLKEVLSMQDVYVSANRDATETPYTVLSSSASDDLKDQETECGPVVPVRKRHHAAGRATIIRVLCLLLSGKHSASAIFDVQDSNGFPILSWCIAQDRDLHDGVRMDMVVENLWQKGASCKCLDRYNQSPLAIAIATKNKWASLQLVLRAGLAPQPREPRCPLLIDVEFVARELAPMLNDKLAAQLVQPIQDDSGDTFLHHAVQDGTLAPALRDILRRVNCARAHSLRDKTGNTILHWVATAEMFAIVSECLGEGVGKMMAVRNLQGQSAVHAALQRCTQSSEAIHGLLLAFIDHPGHRHRYLRKREQNMQNAFHVLASCEGAAGTISYAVERIQGEIDFVEFDEPDLQGHTPLAVACKACNGAEALALLYVGSSMNALERYQLEYIYTELSTRKNMQSQQDLRALSEKQLRSFCIAAVQKEFQKTAARRCKIMVVGRERAGKTTLVQSILKDQYVAQANSEVTVTEGRRRWMPWSRIQRRSTDGISVHDYIPPGGHILFSLWDFAGQNMYYPAHQCFLTEGTVYFIVFDVHMPMEDMKLIEWLNSVQARVPEQTVMLVGTHADKVTVEDLEERGRVIRRIVAQWRASYTSSAIRIKFHPKYCFWPTFKGDPDSIQAIREKMMELSWSQTDDRVSDNVLSLLETIHKLRQDVSKAPILSWSALQSKASAECKEFESDVELESALAVLHRWGEVLFFGGQSMWRLSNFIVVHPQWIVNIMRSVISFRFIEEKKEARRNPRKAMEIALVEREVLHERWSGLHVDSSLFPFLVTLLEQEYRLLISLPQKPNHYLIPSLLQNATPPAALEEWHAMCDTSDIIADIFSSSNATPRRSVTDSPMTSSRQSKRKQSPLRRNRIVALARDYCIPFEPAGFSGRLLVALLEMQKNGTAKVDWFSAAAARLEFKQAHALIQLKDDPQSAFGRVVSVRTTGTCARGAMAVLHKGFNRILSVYAGLLSSTRFVVRVGFECDDGCVAQWDRNSIQVQLFRGEKVTYDGEAVDGSLLLPELLGLGVVSVDANELVDSIALEESRLLDQLDSTFEQDVEKKAILGEGQSGVVHQCTWKGKLAAVKILKRSVGSSSLDEWRKEIELLSILSHPNVVRMYAFYTNPPSIVCEFISGGSLQAYLKSPCVVSWALLYAIALEIARGMSHFHAFEPPILHRDLRAANILIVSLDEGAEVHVKIADVGNAMLGVLDSSHDRLYEGTAGDVAGYRLILRSLIQLGRDHIPSGNTVHVLRDRLERVQDNLNVGHYNVLAFARIVAALMGGVSRSSQPSADESQVSVEEIIAISPRNSAALPVAEDVSCQSVVLDPSAFGESLVRTAPLLQNVLRSFRASKVMAKSSSTIEAEATALPPADSSDNRDVRTASTSSPSESEVRAQEHLDAPRSEPKYRSGFLALFVLLWAWLLSLVGGANEPIHQAGGSEQHLNGPGRDASGAEEAADTVRSEGNSTDQDALTLSSSLPKEYFELSAKMEELLSLLEQASERKQFDGVLHVCKDIVEGLGQRGLGARAIAAMVPILDNAVRTENLAFVRALVNTCGDGGLALADPGVTYSLMCSCIDWSMRSAVELIRGHLPVATAVRNGSRPLHYAAKKGHIEIVQLLLKENVPINAQDDQGRTALMIAVQAGELVVANHLVICGASLRCTDGRKWNVLDYTIEVSMRVRTAEYESFLTNLLMRGVPVSVRLQRVNGLAHIRASVYSLLRSAIFDKDILTSISPTLLSLEAAGLKFMQDACSELRRQSVSEATQRKSTVSRMKGLVETMTGIASASMSGDDDEAVQHTPMMAELEMSRSHRSEKLKITFHNHTNMAVSITSLASQFDAFIVSPLVIRLAKRTSDTVELDICATMHTSSEALLIFKVESKGTPSYLFTKITTTYPKLQKDSNTPSHKERTI